MAWKDLCNCYAPHEVFDLMQLLANFNNCVLESYDPDECCIKSKLICDQMTQIMRLQQPVKKILPQHFCHPLAAQKLLCSIYTTGLLHG